MMYEKIGFRHLKVEPGVYKRANIKMMIDIDEVMQPVTFNPLFKESSAKYFILNEQNL